MHFKITVTLFTTILVILILSCNIFGPFHGEGTGDNVDTLLEDGISAYENEDYDKALDIIKKGLEKDSTNADLLFLRAQCVLQKYEIDIAKVIEPFQIENGSALSAARFRGMSFQKSPGDTTILFDFSEDELVRLFIAFNQVSRDLIRIAEMLENGSLNAGNAMRYFYYYHNDLYLSAGISHIFMGFLRILDNDSTLNKFSSDSLVYFYRNDSKYHVGIKNVPKSVIRDLVKQNLHYFQTGRSLILRYYAGTLYPLNLPYVQNKKSNANWRGFLAWFSRIEEIISAEYPLPENPPYPLPFTIQGNPPGTIFRAAQELYDSLWRFTEGL